MKESLVLEAEWFWDTRLFSKKKESIVSKILRGGYLGLGTIYETFPEIYEWIYGIFQTCGC